MAEPIEITPRDIIKRPLENAALTGAKEAVKKPNFIQQMKDGLNQVKEIKSLLDDLGLDVGDILGGGFGKKPPSGQPPADARALPEPSGLSGLQQAKNFCRLLQLKYGDIPINEMLEKLKAEFGEKKISDFIK